MQSSLQDLALGDKETIPALAQGSQALQGWQCSGWDEPGHICSPFQTPLGSLRAPFWGVWCCSCSGGVLGAQAGAAGEGRRESSASSCLCKGLVTAHLRRLLFFQATSEWGKVLSQGVEELISERAQAPGVCRSSLTQICVSQGWRSTCSRAGGPQAQTDPTGLCRDRSGWRALLAELGTPGQGAARAFTGSSARAMQQTALKGCMEVNSPSPPPSLRTSYG